MRAIAAATALVALATLGAGTLRSALAAATPQTAGAAPGSVGAAARGAAAVRSGTRDGPAVISAANASRLRRVATLDVPGSYVNAIAFLPDGGTLLAADRNGEVLAWEAETGALRTVQPPLSTRATDDSARVPFYGMLAVSPDGRTIVTSAGEGTLTARDAAGRVVATFAYGSPVYATAMSPDGRFLAVGGLRGDIAVHDLVTGARVADLQCDHVYVSVLAWSPDGRTLVAGYERPGNVMKAWNAAEWQEGATVHRLAERTDYHDAVFTRDGTRLIVGRIPADIEVVDVTSGEVVRRLVGHTRAPYQLALSPDGALLASAADDGTVRLWDMATGAVVRVIETGDHELYSVAFSPDGTWLAFSVSGEGVQAWAVAP